MGQILAEILAMDAEDGLVFDTAGMTSEDIREDTGYPCRRYKVPYRFGARHAHFIKLDMSFGDPVTPGPQAIKVHPILADFQGGRALLPGLHPRHLCPERAVADPGPAQLREAHPDPPREGRGETQGPEPRKAGPASLALLA